MRPHDIDRGQAVTAARNALAGAPPRAVALRRQWGYVPSAMTRREKRVWLDADLGFTENGHYQLTGTYGHELIVVVLDPTTLRRLPEDGRNDAILAMRRQIEDAAL